jgi:hypothetical protein
MSRNGHIVEVEGLPELAVDHDQSPALDREYRPDDLQVPLKASPIDLS